MIPVGQFSVSKRGLASSIQSMFSNGEQGAWYDPSDLSTGNMYQLSNQTTPVTAMEQPVGWIRDKSGRNNHAFQATSANRPTLSARYNGLRSTEDLSTSFWVLVGSATRTSTTLTVTTSTTDGIYNTAGNFLGSVASGVSMTCSVELSGSGTIRFGVLNGNGSTRSFQVITLTSTPTRYTNTFVNDATGVNIGIILNSNGVATTVTVGKADFRITNDLYGIIPAYQRVTTATDYDTVGFPSYLRFNGNSSALLTNSIDFSGTDKMNVWAGLRKLSDAARGMLTELSTTVVSSNGSFFVDAPPVAASPAYRFYGGGTIDAEAASPSSYPAPITNVLTGIEDISAPNLTLRLNGAQVITSTATQGTGNFGNFPLYIGARGGSSLWFNGRLYGLVVRGASSNASQIERGETYMNVKTGKVY